VNVDWVVGILIKSVVDSNKRGNRNEQKAFLHRISKRKTKITR